MRASRLSDGQPCPPAPQMVRIMAALCVLACMPLASAAADADAVAAGIPAQHLVVVHLEFGGDLLAGRGRRGGDLRRSEPLQAPGEGCRDRDPDEDGEGKSVLHERPS